MFLSIIIIVSFSGDYTRPRVWYLCYGWNCSSFWWTGFNKFKMASQNQLWLSDSHTHHITIYLLSTKFLRQVPNQKVTKFLWLPCLPCLPCMLSFPVNIRVVTVVGHTVSILNTSELPQSVLVTEGLEVKNFVWPLYQQYKWLCSELGILGCVHITAIST